MVNCTIRYRHKPPGIAFIMAGLLVLTPVAEAQDVDPGTVIKVLQALASLSNSNDPQKEWDEKISAQLDQVLSELNTVLTFVNQYEDTLQHGFANADVTHFNATIDNADEVIKRNIPNLRSISTRSEAKKNLYQAAVALETEIGTFRHLSYTDTAQPAQSYFAYAGFEHLILGLELYVASAKLSGQIGDPYVYSVLSDALGSADLLNMELSANNYRSLAWIKLQFDNAASRSAGAVTGFPADCYAGVVRTYVNEPNPNGPPPATLRMPHDQFYWVQYAGQITATFSCQVTEQGNSHSTCLSYAVATNEDALNEGARGICTWLNGQASTYQSATASSAKTATYLQMVVDGVNALTDSANKLKPKGRQDLPGVVFR